MYRHRRPFFPIIGLILSTTVLADSHLWRFNEIFSNADGTIQFIEMRECCGQDHEFNLIGHWIGSVSTDSTFYFPSNLVPPTGHRHLLFGTPGFAALPGAPTPDYIIPENFVAIDGDILLYSFYSNATMHVPPLPVDGVSVMGPLGEVLPTNTPTNYAGETGTVDLRCSDGDGDGFGAPGHSACPSGPQDDCDDDNPLVFPGAEEICDDQLDNNCNGLVDLEDPACAVEFPGIPSVSVWGILIIFLGLAIAAKIRMGSAQTLIA